MMKLKYKLGVKNALLVRNYCKCDATTLEPGLVQYHGWWMEAGRRKRNGNANKGEVAREENTGGEVPKLRADNLIGPQSFSR